MRSDMKFAAALLTSGLIAAAAYPASAATMRSNTALATSAEWSSQASQDKSKIKKKKRKSAQAAGPAPHAFGWRGADPSFGPDGRPYPRPAPSGRCLVDLGYGRWESCDAE